MTKWILTRLVPFAACLIGLYAAFPDGGGRLFVFYLVISIFFSVKKFL